MIVACLLAVGGWVFAQDKPAAPAAPAAAPAPPPKPDPAGTATGGIADVTAKEAGKPTLAELADFAGHNRVSINLMWTLLAGFLVMLMQAGFALQMGGLGPIATMGGSGVLDSEFTISLAGSSDSSSR